MVNYERKIFVRETKLLENTASIIDKSKKSLKWPIKHFFLRKSNCFMLHNHKKKEKKEKEKNFLFFSSVRLKLRAKQMD